MTRFFTFLGLTLFLNVGQVMAQADTLVDAYLWHQQFFFELDDSRQPAPILLERTGSYENVANFTDGSPSWISPQLCYSQIRGTIK